MKRILMLLLTLCLTLSLCACSNPLKAAQTTLENTASQETVLDDASAPPSFLIMDLDDSTQTALTLEAIYYEWHYLEDGEEVTLSQTRTDASGDAVQAVMAASDTALQTLMMDDDSETYYTVDPVATPDKMTQTSWKAEYIGDESADAMQIYIMLENFYSLPLKTERVYEITVVWDEENFQSRGYYGTATYMFLTQ